MCFTKYRDFIAQVTSNLFEYFDNFLTTEILNLL